MGKINTSTITGFILTVLCLFALPAQAQYNGGSGDPCDPYQINDPCQLNAIGTDPCDWDKHFILTADIDLSAYTGEQFNIIAPDANDVESGFQGTIFTGSFDGNGHIINNFTYSTDTDFIGLFGSVGIGGEIKNLGMTNVSVNGNKFLGGLVGYNSGSISNCYTTGSVSGNSRLGGLVGINVDMMMGDSGNGNISDCHADGNVTGNFGVGGMVGCNMFGNISNCYANGDVMSNGDNSHYLGGLVGDNYGSISKSYATGSVSSGDGSYSLGGLVGNNSGSINNSYATGGVSDGDNSYDLGGLVGENSGSINNSYATGGVSGGDNSYYLGGLVGYNVMMGEVSSSFWDVQTSGQSTSSGGIGLSTEQMKTRSTYVEAGWDFACEIVNGYEDIWLIADGLDYPRLALLYNYGGGEGTEQQPYLIYTTAELYLVRGQLGNHFRLMADIDWNEYGGKDIMMGEYPDYPFSGVFDGNGHTIYNFAYEVAAQDFVGFFGYVTGEDAEIKNLKLVDIDICAATGDYVGGLVGYNNGGRITDVSVTGSVTGWCGVGGLAGVNYNGLVRRCHADCTVDGYEDAGGLVGINYSDVTNCCSAGNVIGMRFIGGLVGYNWDGDVTNSFSTGSVTAFDFFGGLIGHNRDGTIADSFWDVQTSGQSTSYGGTGLETTLMQTQSTFTDAGWDFMGESTNGTNDIWDICEGTNYPKLSWQFLPGDFVCPDGVDLSDFAVLADTWSLSSGQTGYNDLCDLMDDDMIDLADLAIFAENWLEGKM